MGLQTISLEPFQHITQASGKFLFVFCITLKTTLCSADALCNLIYREFGSSPSEQGVIMRCLPRDGGRGIVTRCSVLGVEDPLVR